MGVGSGEWEWEVVGGCGLYGVGEETLAVVVGVL